MPRPQRTAKYLNSAAVMDDLRLIREVGGIHRAGPDRLQSVLRLMFPDEPRFVEQQLPYARSAVETHINRVCEALANSARNDPCDLATATSLRALMLGRLAEDTKALTTRKLALEGSGCGLTPDGIRKREDRALRDVAEALYEDLSARNDHAPQTIEEAVRELRPLAQEARADLHETLQFVYPLDPPRDEDWKITAYARVVWLVTGVQGWSRKIVDLGLRPTKLTKGEEYFSSMAVYLTDLGLAKSVDKDLTYDVYMRPEVEADFALWNTLVDEPGGPELLGRWVAWITSCWSSCAYHRSSLAAKCEPHRFIETLEEFEIGAAALDSGTIDELLGE